MYRHLTALVVLGVGDQSNRPSSSGFGLACGGTITSMLPGSGVCGVYAPLVFQLQRLDNLSDGPM
jgi:hypothetical protein